MRAGVIRHGIGLGIACAVLLAGGTVAQAKLPIPLPGLGQTGTLDRPSTRPNTSQASQAPSKDRGDPAGSLERRARKALPGRPDLKDSKALQDLELSSSSSPRRPPPTTKFTPC